MEKETATVEFNERTQHWELIELGGFVRYMSYDEDAVYGWAEFNGYEVE